MHVDAEEAPLVVLYVPAAHARHWEAEEAPLVGL